MSVPQEGHRVLVEMTVVLHSAVVGAYRVTVTMMGLMLAGGVVHACCGPEGVL